ncbi:ribosome small subunit-dependent GTPase A [Ideonella azotifigens]|uniref:Small ribosomal subunit biogenesis GTPase RsgA n=2 Tax=Ideonella azotifigens TaxID=513160 RepID=A0ABN1JI18_9BURK|nr:ribosome small subunit-dependent GTPase A [Ideonella azotifigens]MCD2343554.1 ribosome small subunit-dependent GTPase A [Ideonella azotifigens]
MIETIDFEALRRIGLQQALLAQSLSLPHEAGDRLMRITEVQRDRFTLHDGHQPQRAQLWPTLRLALQMQDEQLVVGDWVSVRDTAPGESWVAARVPPLNRLLRRDSSGRRQALVSNVDSALLVMTCGHDFNLRRLDRYLALVRLAGVQPVVVLTQADLHPDPASRLRAVRQHLGSLGATVPVVAVNGLTPEAAEPLRPWLSVGQTLVLLGSSGAGKSTLTNTLTGDKGQSTGPAREGDGRGRHTTTARSMHWCTAGACIIDTPGLRGLQLDAGGDELDSAFDDVARLAPNCRFRDCEHRDEPGCAVRPMIAPERLLSYQKLQREAQRHELTLQDRREQLAVWKARGREAKVAIRAKRG